MKRDSISTQAGARSGDRSPEDVVPHRSITKPTGGEGWARVPDLIRSSSEPLPAPWAELFAPLENGSVDELVVIAQIGQSLDGRIATHSGHSHYINGIAGRAHLHRLRALVDAVVVGVGTVVADDPQLTVRLVPGPNPARVVLDPRGRLPVQARVLSEDGSRRVVVTTTPRPTLPAGRPDRRTGRVDRPPAGKGLDSACLNGHGPKLALFEAFDCRCQKRQLN